ncbi:MAG: threonylcarbamoyl-AMP synthase [Spirochaetales bacterium]|nr:threonylcarbamoyl-AMP synthase [Spirochaetales bacterium]
MIEYIFAHNIDDRIIVRAVTLLQEGGLVAFPTDSSWSIGCSIQSKTGIERLKKLKDDHDEHHFTLICSGIHQISDLASLSTSHFRTIKRLTPGPFVFVLPSLTRIEKIIQMKRKEIGVRIPDNPVPLRLVDALGLPLYSITAKRSMMDERLAGNAFDEELMFDMGWEIEEIPGVSMVLDPGEEHPRIMSTVLDLTGEEVTVLRQGVGVYEG